MLVALGSAALGSAALGACGAFGSSDPAPSSTVDAGIDGPSNAGDGAISIDGATPEKARMFVVGGRTAPDDAGDYPFLSDVWIADVLADGKLSAWSLGPSLSFSLANLATVATSKTLLAIGGEGAAPNNPSRKVFAAPFTKDGIGSWGPTTELTPQIEFHAAVLAATKVHVIGGDPPGTDALDKTYSADLDSNGNVGAWTEGVIPSNERRRKHGAVVYDGYLYVVGGEAPDDTAAPCRPNVLATKIGDNGEIGSLTSVGRTISRHHAATVAHRGYLYVLGGWICGAGATITNTVFVAKIEKGQVQEIKTTTPLNPARYALGVAAVGDYLFAIGGDVTGSGPTKEVLAARINPEDGTVGGWYTVGSDLPKPIAYHSVAVISR
jgi:hypothetical protein